MAKSTHYANNFKKKYLRTLENVTHERLVLAKKNEYPKHNPHRKNNPAIETSPSQPNANKQSKKIHTRKTASNLHHM